MAAGMGSPERTPIVPNPDGQGSPFFHFLCSLSPIKPVRSGHVVAQTFSELSFAPPPSVFVSPKESSRSCRSSQDERRQKDNTSYTKRKIFTSMLDNTMTGKKSKFTIEPSLLASPVNDKLIPERQEYLTSSSNSSSPRNLDTNLMGGEKLGVTNPCAPPCGSSVEEESLDATSRINLVPRDYAPALKSFDLHPLATMCEYANEEGIPNDFMTCGNPVNGSEIASWREDIPSRQIPSILSAPMQRTVEETIQNIDLHGSGDSYSMPTHIHNNEQVCDESTQAVSCRAGIRRRCLDFETLEDQKRSSDHVPLLDISFDKSCHPSFLNTLGMKSDFQTTTTSTTTTTTTTAQTASNMHLVSRYTMDNPTMFASTNEHALYPPLRPELEICARGSNLEAPRPNTTNELSYKVPAMHNYPCIHQSHESPLIDIDNSHGHVPTNVSRDSNTNHSHGNHYNVSGDNLDLEAVLSLVERIGVSKSLSSDAHVSGLGMQNSCFPTTFDMDSIHNLENRLFTCGAAPPEISHCHQSESNHAEDDSGHISSDCGSNKKRKLSIDDNPSGEGCKNCKCKKSKCLKLYCECFAAGVYCVGGCRCSNCYNRPEFEDIVLQTREQIESRNPSAFVPKIIRAPVSSPTTIGEECHDVTPAPTRHKRGCNCKKSQCSKKYCECYQAGIGCGEGCRCEGCRNIFGRKEGSAEVDETEQQKTPVETMSSSNEEMIQMDSRPTPDHHPQTDQKSRVLSPVTPYLNEHSGPYVQPLVKSGEQSCSPFALSVLPTMAFNSPCRIFEALEGRQNFGQILMNPQSNLSTLAHNLTDDAPSHPDGLNDIYSLHRPLPQLSEDDYTLYSRISTSQSYWQNQGHSIPTELPGLTSQESSLIEHLRPSIFSSDNYQFHTRDHDGLTVPVTPLLLPASSVARRNFEDLDEMSETPSHSQVWLGDENSPNVYNDPNSFCAPEIVLKTRSPQQKRVFSHHQSSKADGRAIVSPGSAFKNGRKFILHALPSSSGLLDNHESMTDPYIDTQ